MKRNRGINCKAKWPSLGALEFPRGKQGQQNKEKVRSRVSKTTPLHMSLGRMYAPNS